MPKNTETITFDTILANIEEIIPKTRWFPMLPPQCQIIFRGTKCDYTTGLLPKIFRPNIASHFSENYLIEEFQRAHPRYFDSCSNELDWLSIMRHYGIPTRLLDWTTSLPVALYFASRYKNNFEAEDIISEDGVLYYQIVTPQETINVDNNGNSGLWGFSNFIGQLVQAKNIDDVTKWCVDHYSSTVIRDSFLYRPKQFHDRVKNQHGLFTVSIAKKFNMLGLGEIISSNLDCLEKYDFLKRFLSKAKIYWCQYSEKTLKEKIEKYKKLNHSELNILILVNQQTKFLALYMQGLETPLFTQNAECLRTDIAEELTFEPNDEVTVNGNAGILNNVLRNSNPIVMTKVFRIIKETMEVNSEDLLPQNIHKIIIPHERKAILQKQLSLMGMSHSYLYPEPSNFFQGLSERFYNL